MKGRCCIAAALAALLTLSGCGGTELLRHPGASNARQTTTTPAPDARQYLAQLRAAEQQLAEAERSIPTTAATPQALSQSTSLLAAAVSRLGDNLSAITPPPSVGKQHAQLVSVVRVYAQQLRSAAALATKPGGETQAGSLLVSATNRASAQFNATLAAIYSTLHVRPT
jgi:hypothetical protein